MNAPSMIFILMAEVTLGAIVALACLCVLAVAGMFEVRQSGQAALIPVTSGRRTSWEIE